MTVVGIAMVRDEEDIIEPCLRHMATQVDSLVVADNLSVDNTRSILDRLAEELDIEVLDDLDPAFAQSRKMTALAAHAAEHHCAIWVVPFDADEAWTWDIATVKECLESQALDIDVVPAVVWDHIATGRDDDDPNPHHRMLWHRSAPLHLGDVACRWSPDLVIAPGNHSAKYGKDTARVSADELKVHHYRYRTPEQMVTCLRNGYAAHKAAGVPKSTGAHFWRGGELLESNGEQAIHDLFYAEHFSEDADGLVCDPL